ncbi:MAG: putative bifunctional diguanylate cyclase/phosphodiesterase, partial [Acidimicrobiales bacterium]
AGLSVDNDRLVERLRREAAERAYEASHDSLTGLASRSLLSEELTAALALPDPAIALLLIDLDHFKDVNDTLGHHNGDQLLIQAAGRLTDLVGQEDVVARLGGDEFGILLRRQEGPAEALATAHRVCLALQAPYRIEEITVEVAASIGVVTGPGDGTDVVTLLQRADVAMYRAKADQVGALLYDPDQDHHSRRRLALAGELRLAVEQGDLTVSYQPVVDMADGRLIGAEALARWPHPRLQQVAPDEFIPLAERTALVWPLTRLVLGRALEQCAAWRRSGLDLGINVNLSARSLVDADLVAKVEALLADAGLPADALTLEVTESSLVSDLSRSVEALRRLRTAGVGLAIDDFGVGHASLTYLRRLPCDEIKVDRSFVQGMAVGRADMIIVSSTIALAHSLGLHVVAEGVEDVGAWGRLRSMGCDAAQGYLMAPALTPVRFQAWADGWEHRRHNLIQRAERLVHAGVPRGGLVRRPHDPPGRVQA